MEGFGLSRAKSFDFPTVNLNAVKGKSTGEEICQENLKHSLQEIISEIEQAATGDTLLLDDTTPSHQQDTSSGLIRETPITSSLRGIVRDANMMHDPNRINGRPKSLSEQLNSYWITPAESSPSPQPSTQTTDLLDFYSSSPIPKTKPTAEAVPTTRENESEEKEAATDELHLQEDDVMGEINSLIVHLEEITKRPKSLPPDINIFHLWKSLQIANELNQKLKEEITVDNAPYPGKVDKLEEKSGKLPPKPIDLDKLFTPAPDSDDLIIKDRKLYTSSSFYSPNHPTLEDQVNLARSISKSLTDISNHESKGQSMYVNRKKRSVKWVHEGEGRNPNLPPYTNSESPSPNKQLLTLVTDPRGQVQDIRSLRKQGYEPDHCLSPEICFDLVRDLNGPKGKGAELFAKRRKKSEKWIVDEKNVKSSSSFTSNGGVTPLAPPQTPPSNKLPPPPPSYLPGNTKRVEQVQKMNEIQERLSQPRVRLIKSPWEAALETGSVDTAFVAVEPRGFVVAPSPSSFEHISRGSSRDAPAPPPRQYHPLNIDYSSLSNYNTAPRGWGRGIHVYKPVHLDMKPVHLDMKPVKVSLTPTYTDF